MCDVLIRKSVIPPINPDSPVKRITVKQMKFLVSFCLIRWEQLLEDSRTRKERLQHAQDQYKKVIVSLLDSCLVI